MLYLFVGSTSDSVLTGSTVDLLDLGGRPRLRFGWASTSYESEIGSGAAASTQATFVKVGMRWLSAPWRINSLANDLRSEHSPIMTPRFAIVKKRSEPLPLLLCFKLKCLANSCISWRWVDVNEIGKSSWDESEARNSATTLAGSKTVDAEGVSCPDEESLCWSGVLRAGVFLGTFGVEEADATKVVLELSGGVTWLEAWGGNSSSEGSSESRPCLIF